MNRFVALGYACDRNGRRYILGDHVEVVLDGSTARTPGRDGLRKPIPKGLRGVYQRLVNGDNNLALVEFHQPVGQKKEMLEISLGDIGRATA
ncbi:hypothetical protein BH11PAT2_BH11PAT2_05580 [soil metagenome]